MSATSDWAATHTNEANGREHRGFPVVQLAPADFRANLARHSRSFALASRLLPASRRDDVAVVYAWCRRADDAIDFASGALAERALERLRAELHAIYAGAPQSEPTLAAFQNVVAKYGIPATYPHELLNGMAMDVHGARYHTFDVLFTYCYRVAGTVGLMMCHVLGVSDRRALQHATHLGIAMQLTNIARDVAEDWQRGRLYVPEELLGSASFHERLGQPLQTGARPALAAALGLLLQKAELYYRSADRGLGFLSFGASLSVRTARWVYSAIGARLAHTGYDVFAGRAVVPSWLKLLLVARACAVSLLALPRTLFGHFVPVPLGAALEERDVVRL